MYVPNKDYENIISQIETVDGGIVIPRLVVHNQKININKTAYYIFNQVNGIRTLKEISDEYYKIFNAPTNIVAMNDVRDVLYSLWLLGVIKWEDGNHPFSDKYEKQIDDYSVKLIVNEDIDEYLETISSEKGLEYFTPYRYKSKTLNKSYLQYAVVNNITRQFLIRYKEEVCLALMLSIDAFEVMIHIDYFNILNENLYKSIPDSIIDKLFKWIQQKMLQVSQQYIIKKAEYVNWMLSVNPNDKVILDILESKEASAKALLENETFEGDVITYYFQQNV